MSMPTITTLPWAGTLEAEADTALWLDGSTAEAHLREFGHGPEASTLICVGLKAIANAIVEQRKEFPNSTLAELDVHPSMVWRPMRTSWSDGPISRAHVIDLHTLICVLEDPLLLQQARDRKPTQLSPEAVILLERYALRVRDKQN